MEGETVVPPEGLIGTPAQRVDAAVAALAGTPAGALLEGLVAAVDAVPADAVGWARFSPEQARVVLAGLYALEQRLRGVVDAAVAVADRDGWTDEVGLGLPGWLHQFNSENRSGCVRRVRRARRVAGQPVVADAVVAGEMSPDQGDAVARMLGELPDAVGVVEQARAAETMVELAAGHDPASLAGLSGYLLEVVAPDRAEELLGEQLEQQEARAARSRELHFLDDGHGSVLVRGRLPVVEAAQVRCAIDALAGRATRSGAGARADALGPVVLDPELEAPLSQRRADALVELAALAAAEGSLPAHGGDRPRVVVTIDQGTLARDAGAVQLDDGTQVSWARARQIACDAGVLPIVLDGAGRPVDVGREQRFFTGAARLAVLQRDRGCAFPGCDRPPRACDVHHITPWWDGGGTALGNGVALCRHHHGIVEPRPGADQWAVVLAGDGLPEFVPPRALDPSGQHRVHARFQLRRLRRGGARDRASAGVDDDESE